MHKDNQDLITVRMTNGIHIWGLEHQSDERLLDVGRPGSKHLRKGAYYQMPLTLAEDLIERGFATDNIMTIPEVVPGAPEIIAEKAADESESAARRLKGKDVDRLIKRENAAMKKEKSRADKLQKDNDELRARIEALEAAAKTPPPTEEGTETN